MLGRCGAAGRKRERKQGELCRMSDLEEGNCRRIGIGGNGYEYIVCK